MQLCAIFGAKTHVVWGREIREFREIKEGREIREFREFRKGVLGGSATFCGYRFYVSRKIYIFAPLSIYT